MSPSTSGRPWTASVVVPAHNEAQSIGHLLSALTTGATKDEVDVVVVCNGCTDETATVARSYGHPVRVVETPQPSKRLAQELGDDIAQGFPRAYVDADVVLTLNDLKELVRPLDQQVLATAPARRWNDELASVWVRMYYRVWDRLPQVRSGLFGRGVIVVSEAGHRRIANMPRLLSDDLAMSEMFAARERRVVDTAAVVITPPRTVADLLRRRERVATGNVQADALGVRGAAARTSISTLWAMLRAEPVLSPSILVFLTITAVARLRSGRRVRAGDYTTWGRDESSRRLA